MRWDWKSENMKTWSLPLGENAHRVKMEVVCQQGTFRKTAEPYNIYMQQIMWSNASRNLCNSTLHTANFFKPAMLFLIEPMNLVIEILWKRTHLHVCQLPKGVDERGPIPALGWKGHSTVCWTSASKQSCAKPFFSLQSNTKKTANIQNCEIERLKLNTWTHLAALAPKCGQGSKPVRVYSSVPHPCIASQRFRT